jgi:hypothetical protein
MGHLRRLMESHPSLSRVPDQTLIAGDPGTGPQHVRATRGNGYALVYTPTGRALEISLGKISGETVKAAWFNPRSGETTALGDVENHGRRAFDPPGEEGPGRDWVLVLEVSAATPRSVAPRRRGEPVWSAMRRPGERARRQEATVGDPARFPRFSFESALER